MQDGPEIIEVICPEIQEIIPTAATKTLDDNYTIIAQETGAKSPCKIEYTDKSVWTRTNC